MANRADVTLRSVSVRGEQLTENSRPDFADLPPGVGFEPKDEPLRRDINLLGRILGQVIVEQEGKGLFGAEEEIRLLCRRLRFEYDPGLDERLRARIERMGPGELGRIVRAFSVYFQLVNIAERYHRIRRAGNSTSRQFLRAGATDNFDPYPSPGSTRTSTTTRCPCPAEAPRSSPTSSTSREVSAGR